MLRTARPVFSRSFLISLVSAWLAIVAAALVYRHIYPADRWLLTAALPACLLESAFYLGATFQRTREWFSHAFTPLTQALLLWISSLLPYLTFALFSGTFHGNAFVLLATLSGLFSFWYAVSPRRLPYDIGFFVIAAAPLLAHAFKRIYISPDPQIAIDLLGHLMWIRVGITALLSLRGWDPGEFSLWPKPREWRLGLLYYVLVLVPLCMVGIALGDVQFEPLRKSPLTVVAFAVGTFFGILWVVALSEELFFRGFVARALLKCGYQPVVAVLLSAVLFGCAHLWFHAFPNWRRAIVAAVLGLGCGFVYLRTQSVRAPMVTHALAVTTWRLFFR
jgi:membrane protease YdiL (CAAX protease family)